jgi:MoxR-like ATPase
VVTINKISIPKRIRENIGKVIVGNDRAIELIQVALLAEGHVLLEDIPGVGKTLLAKSLARSIGGVFKRIQCTPDLLPSDITGYNIYDQRINKFSFREGPVISNVLLTDEINRTIPRTQASLLECMEERQVTIDGETFTLPRPFLVIATQNPIELEGTFPLPEAQLDRFLMKIGLGYPDRDEELIILDRFQGKDPFEDLAQIVEPEQIVELQHLREEIHIANSVKEYIIDIIRATRNHKSFSFGASPRASIALIRASQALALLRGRDFVLPDDIKELVVPILSHRLILTREERLKGNNPAVLIEEIIKELTVPVN